MESKTSARQIPLGLLGLIVIENMTSNYCSSSHDRVSCYCGSSNVENIRFGHTPNFKITCEMLLPVRSS